MGDGFGQRKQAQLSRFRHFGHDVGIGQIVQIVDAVQLVVYRLQPINAVARAQHITDVELAPLGHA